MGNLSFAELKDQLRVRNGNNSAYDTAGTEASNYYGLWINKAYRQLCTQDNVLGVTRKIRFPQTNTSTTATTVDGTAYVSVPSDCLFITEVYDTTNNRKLDEISWKSYIEYTDRTTTTSENYPTEWTRYGERIYLHPTPDAAYTVTIYYKKLVEDLTGTTTTIIGAEWDDPIIELASYIMYTWLGEYDKAKYCKEQFVAQATGLASLYLNEDRDRDAAFGPSQAYMPGR